MRNKRIEIDPKTNMPVNIDSRATENLALRLTPSYKAAIKSLSLEMDRSMTKTALIIFDYYFTHAVPNDFFDDLDTDQTKNKKSKDSKNRKFWNLFTNV